MTVFGTSEISQERTVTVFGTSEIPSTKGFDFRSSEHRHLQNQMDSTNVVTFIAILLGVVFI